MKILSVEQIREADSFTIMNEPISDIDLMERAATTCFYWLIENVDPDRNIKVFCGTGNNGGDGLAIARLLHSKGYVTAVYIAGNPEKMSDSCRINYERLIPSKEVKIDFMDENTPFPTIDKEHDIVIDALFGSGISREIGGHTAGIIRHLNNSGASIISIDIPSGLFCDSTVTTLKDPAIVHAVHTLTFAPPKLAFFFQETEKYTGEWHLLDIGILKEFIEGAETKNFMVETNDCRSLLKPRRKFSHKGTYGHALLITGGLGKMGAAVLGAKACMRSGPGLVTVHIPRTGNVILQSSVPEAMLSLDSEEYLFSSLPDLSAYNSIGVGPGIGTSSQTQQAVKLLIQNSAIPLVIDADAINILGENKTWIPFVPKGSIFTPHPKEFERIAGKTLNDYERNQRQRDFSVKYGVYVVLKGAHTSITTPDGNCYFNTTGNPGMATGGSGDVLTGIITGIKAQGYTALTSCILGVFLHGLAGDLAERETGQDSLIAGDIIDYLGKSFLTLYGRF
jgi:ADP-dependent NAD(P)H-hydrate dehydratase / NAD(P)H-hydrate epimerase